MENLPLIDKIKERLSKAIVESGMSQKEIAAKVGISQQMISYYKCRQKVPSIDNLAILCKFLDVDTNYILCIDD